MQKINKGLKSSNEHKLKRLKGFAILSGVFVPLAIAPASVISMSVNTQAVPNTAINASTNVKQIFNEVIKTDLKSVAQAAVDENRWLHHAVGRPVGIMVQANVPISIKFADFPADNKGIQAYVGQYVKYPGVNGNQGVESGVQSFAITNQITTITPSLSGMLCFGNTSSIDVTLESVEAEKMITIPTFIQDVTQVNDFLDVAKTTNSPFIIFQSEKFFYLVGTSLFLNYLNYSSLADMNQRTKDIDTIIDITNDFYGLNASYDGVANKASHPIQIITNGSYYATYYRIYADAYYALTGVPGNNWGLIHEIGHSYQNVNYSWDGLGEVLANAANIQVLEHFNATSVVSNFSGVVNATRSYLAKPIAERQFDVNASISAKIGMFYQLYRGFGKSFYPNLNQSYRLMDSSEKPTTSDQEEQLFMIMASKTAQRNLVNFFKTWGLPISEDTINKINELGFNEPSTKIEDNLIQPNVIAEGNLLPYVPTSKSFTDIKPIPLGKDLEHSNEYAPYFGNAQSITKVLPNYLALSKVNDVWSFPVKVFQQEPGKAENLFSDTHSADLTNGAIRINNRSNALVGYIDVDKTNQTIQFTANNISFESANSTAYMGTIALTDSLGNIAYSITCTGSMTFQNILDQMGLRYGLPYSHGEKLEITWAQPNRVLSYSAETNSFVASTQTTTVIDL